MRTDTKGSPYKNSLSLTLSQREREVGMGGPRYPEAFR